MAQDILDELSSDDTREFMRDFNELIRVYNGIKDEYREGSKSIDKDIKEYDVIKQYLSKLKDMRKRIAEFTSVLHDASIDDIDRVASEVVRGIASLLSEHKNKVREIQEKCNRFHAQTLVAGIVSLAPVFIPSLAPFVQYIPPLALAGTLAGKYLWDKTGERFEKGQLSRSLMGVLASAREKST